MLYFGYFKDMLSLFFNPFKILENESVMQNKKYGIIRNYSVDA